MYKKYDELMKNNPNVVIWGTGRTMRKYIGKIDPSLRIRFFADTYRQKWGVYPAKEIDCAYSNLICKSKDEIQSGDVVFIAIEAGKDIGIVAAELDKKGISYCHIIDAVHAYMPVYDALELDRYKKKYGVEQPQKQLPKEARIFKKVVNCHVPFMYCNMRCGYCYIRQVRDFKYKKNYFHSPEFIRAALSKRRLGGKAIINICAGGETLMCREVLPIIKELAEEGHYLSIVTNGTISKAFDELIEAGIDMNRLFIKFSFHYLELKRLDLLEVFINNVNKMRRAGCSITIEITPDDELIPYIDEIKNLSMRQFGALPHITVARDDRTNNLQILSKLTIEDYKRTWGVFDSKLFDYKMEQVYKKRREFCMAGEWSLFINLETGDTFQCLGHPYLDNIYDDICREIRLESVGHGCRLPYCYNVHQYLAYGLIKEIEAPSYYDVRDRRTTDGGHWVHGEIAEIFRQKLYENNKQQV